MLALDVILTFILFTGTLESLCMQVQLRADSLKIWFTFVIYEDTLLFASNVYTFNFSLFCSPPIWTHPQQGCCEWRADMRAGSVEGLQEAALRPHHVESYSLNLKSCGSIVLCLVELWAHIMFHTEVTHLCVWGLLDSKSRFWPKLVIFWMYYRVRCCRNHSLTFQS